MKKIIRMFSKNLDVDYNCNVDKDALKKQVIKNFHQDINYSFRYINLLIKKGCVKV